MVYFALRKSPISRAPLVLGFATGCAFLLSLPHGSQHLAQEKGHVSYYTAPLLLRNLLVFAGPLLALAQGAFTYLCFRAYWRFPPDARKPYSAISIIKLWGAAVMWGVLYWGILDLGFQMFMSGWRE